MILTKADTLKEILMIEMQGEIQYSDKLDGLKLGRLEEGTQKCKFTIGIHVLRGKVEFLSKPLAVVEKSNENLIFTGIIKKKIIFSERPAPIPDHSKQIMKKLG